MTDADRATYEGTYRRGEVALPSLLGAGALFALGLYLVVQHVDGRNFELAIASLAGGTVATLLVILFSAFRVHRWVIEADGIRISERPKVPLLGLRRRALARFGDIRALRVEPALDPASAMPISMDSPPRSARRPDGRDGSCQRLPRA